MHTPDAFILFKNLSPRFSIRHITRYNYEQAVRDSVNQVTLFPLQDEHQEVTTQNLFITGDPPVELFKDYYGNTIGSFTYAEPHKELVIDSKIEVVVHDKKIPPDTTPNETQWQNIQEIRFTYPYIDFIKQERFAALDELENLPAIISSRAHTPLAAALLLNDHVFNNFSYDSAVTDVETTIDEVWKLKQVFARILPMFCW